MFSHGQCENVGISYEIKGDNIKDDRAVAVTIAICTTSCLLSIFGALAIFWSYYRLPEIRNFVRTLMLCLTIADFFTATGYGISTLRYTRYKSTGITGQKACELCIIQSFITTFSSLVSFNLTMAIALHIFLTVMTQRSITGTRTFMVIVNGISVIVPGIIVTIALSNDRLGTDLTDKGNAGTGPWCWLNIERSSKHSYDSLKGSTVSWMFLAGKGWEIACYLVTTSLYVLLKLHLYLQGNTVDLHEIHDSLRNEDKNYMLVWLVLYLIRVWGTLRFFLDLAKVPVKPKLLFTVLENLQAFGDPSQGFFNFCLFCLLDETVRKNMFRACCCSKAAPSTLGDRARLIEDDEERRHAAYGAADGIDGNVGDDYGNEHALSDNERNDEFDNDISVVNQPLHARSDIQDSYAQSFFSVRNLASSSDVGGTVSTSRRALELHQSWNKPTKHKQQERTTV